MQPRKPAGCLSALCLQGDAYTLASAIEADQKKRRIKIQTVE